MARPGGTNTSLTDSCDGDEHQPQVCSRKLGRGKSVASLFSVFGQRWGEHLKLSGKVEQGTVEAGDAGVRNSWAVPRESAAGCG